jgi:hypothetical protein
MKRLMVLVGFLAIGLIAALAPPGTPSEAQQNCYPTGFCIQNSAFLSYYQQRGEHNTLGYPASREFTLEGFQVQIFQRVVLQMNQGNVARLNVLDPGIMPMTRANQSIFPGPDPALAAAAPQQAGNSNYAEQVVQFVQSVSPEQFAGQPVNFFTTFNRAVPPAPGDNPGIITLKNLEIWGVPTSQPASDPGNAGFVYQRFQRGIMHYRNECRCTEGILIGDYFKAVISGQNLPSDLDADMRQSRFYRQYAPGQPNWIARPTELQNTDLTNAFETGTGGAPPPPPAATQAPTGPTQTPTATPVGAPEISTFRVDDDRIDPNDTIQVTIVARDSDGVDWIQFEGEPEENTSDNGNDNEDAPDDPALARQEHNCDDDETECVWQFDVRPTLSGDYKLRARARDVNGNRGEWTEIDLTVREGNATATPTATGAATATPTSQATATPTSTPMP